MDVIFFFFFGLMLELWSQQIYSSLTRLLCKLLEDVLYQDEKANQESRYMAPSEQSILTDRRLRDFPDD